MDDRTTLMHRIQVCGFVLHETHLFLDTHPDCVQALDYYKKYSNLYQEARDKYVAMFGPIAPTDYASGNWNWIDGPWPWEA